MPKTSVSLLDKSKLVDVALDTEGLTKTDIRIFKFILNNYNDDWGYAICGKYWAGEKLNLDPSRVRIGLKRLVCSGLLELVRSGYTQANCYRLLLDKIGGGQKLTDEGSKKTDSRGKNRTDCGVKPDPQIQFTDSHLPDRDRIKFVSGEINENVEGSGRQVFERLGNGNKKPIPKADPESTELDLDQLKKRARKMIDRDRSIQDEDLDYFYENIQDCPSREALFEFMRDEGYPFGQDGLEADPKKGFVEAIKKWGRGVDKKIAKMWIKYNVAKKRTPPTNAKQFYAWIGAYIRVVNQANLLAETGGVA